MGLAPMLSHETEESPNASPYIEVTSKSVIFNPNRAMGKQNKISCKAGPVQSNKR